MDIELLLARADDQRPVLDGGLPLEAASKEPNPEEKRRVGAEDFADFAEDPNDLTLQRWGIIAPVGPEGDRLLGIVEPLRRKRQEDQEGAPVILYRVPAGMDKAASIRWKKDVYRDESSEADQPRYLLILGDIDGVSLELQQVLSSDLLVGRLVCSSEAGYAAYVDKVLRWERAPSPDTHAPALFYTVRDGTAATTIGHKALVAPSIARCRETQRKGSLRAKEVQELVYDDVGGFLDQIVRPEPSMLFTMSHGLGAPRGGFRSLEEQRAVQGAMSLGGGVRLTAADIGERYFLPGGIWFFLACYGGGTPAKSAYHEWLTRLHDVGAFGGRVDGVLAGLPKAGDRPFIAALPQAALANPNGPLAIVAHLDLAWTYGFQDLGPGGKDRPSRFEGVFRSVVNGSRSGNTHNQLLRFVGEANYELTELDDEEAKLVRAGQSVAADKARAQHRANLWMLRQDLAGYILLGDPATRLPLNRDKAAATTVRPAPRPADVRPPALVEPTEPPAIRPDPAVMEEAVIAALIGDEAEKAIAARHGITRAELQRWVETYRTMGRSALGKLT